MRKDGYFGGLTQYRYGSPPKPRHIRIYSGRQREHVVHRLFEAVRHWSLSPFEFEGAVRASVRSMLCLAGHGWGAADTEAGALVTEALARLRAVRPTWEQGQPEYLIPRENCKRCGADIPEELQVGGRNHRFCSDICARAAIEQREYEGLRKHSEVYQAAWSVIQRTKSTLSTCRHCQREYRPVLGLVSVYCSRKCAAAAKVRVPDRVCRVCNKSFRAPCGSREWAGFCCSRACDQVHRKSRRYARVCQCCDRAFEANAPAAKFCSDTCSQVVSKFRTGRNLPKRIVPLVFDYMLKMAA